MNLKKGDRVKTMYGNIETVLHADSVQVVTYESALDNRWYHTSKVWKK